MSSIQYILIGNPDDCEEIGHYPDRNAPKDISKEAAQIFQKFVDSGVKTKDLRNSTDNRGKGHYFFTINSNNIFYFIAGDNTLIESKAFELIDILQEANIPLKKDSKTGKLNKDGREQLKTLVEDFMKKNTDKIQETQSLVDKVEGIMKENIIAACANTEDLDTIQQKAIDLEKGAEEYKNSAVKLKRITWWQNCKWIIILAAVIILLIIIIVPISLK